MKRQSNISYIHFGNAEQLLEQLRQHRHTVLVSQSNIVELYPQLFEGKQTLTIEQGEGAKTLESYAKLMTQLIECGANRETLLVGVGGGIVTDMVGFVGSTYMRGMPFGFISTTLLGQVDASIGGKNGVNVEGYKNMVGTFGEPEFVIIDTNFLKTLPARELSAAGGEIIKYALLMDLGLLQDEDYVRRCVEFKLQLVEEDFRDKGRRQILNLGHTFAHAVEKCSGEYLHGEAVGYGLRLMALYSTEVGLLSEALCRDIMEAIKESGLPTTPPPGVGAKELCSAIGSDKKQSTEKLKLILLKGIAEPVIWESTKEEIEQVLLSIITK